MGNSASQGSNAEEAELKAKEKSPEISVQPVPPSNKKVLLIPVIPFKQRVVWFKTGIKRKPFTFVVRYQHSNDDPVASLETFWKGIFPGKVVEHANTHQSDEMEESWMATLELEAVSDIVKLVRFFMTRYIEEQQEERFVFDIEDKTISLTAWPIEYDPKDKTTKLRVQSVVTQTTEEVLEAARKWKQAPAKPPSRVVTLMRGWARKAVSTRKSQAISAAGVATATLGAATVALGGPAEIRRRGLGLISDELAKANRLYDSFSAMQRALVVQVRRIRRLPPSRELFQQTMKVLKKSLVKNSEVWKESKSK